MATGETREKDEKRKTGKRFSAYLVGLLATSVLVPGLAGFLAVILYLSSEGGPGTYDWFINSDGTRAYGFGSLFALGGWLLCAAGARNYARAAGANPSEYLKLKEIYDVLSARAAAAQPQTPAEVTALAEARVNLDYAEPSFTFPGPSPPSFRWGTGDAYLDLRERLHRAEEALIEVEPVSLAIGEADYDVRRVEGAKFADGARLLKQLANARETLVGKPDDAIARTTLREVRRAINEYRDSLRAGLIRARNHLFATAIYASLNAYALLGVAMIAGAGRSTVLAASVFYLIGATVGLFRQLQLASTTVTTQEDYGLESMRLIQTPLFCGLAAIGGVVLTSIVLFLSTPPAGAATGSSSAASTKNIPKLTDIFDLKKNPMGLVVAAVFGLTPTLLVTRLRAQSEALKVGLKSSELGDTATGG